MKPKIITRIFAAGLAVICAAAYSPAEIGDVEVFSGSSVLASAEDAVPYIIWNEATQKLVDATCIDYEIISSETNVFKNGKWYLVNGRTEVINRISVEGTAHLILADGANLNAASGITVEADSSLFIYGQTNGTGELTATCTNYNNVAGIGSKNGGKCGSVTINRGIITVSGGMNAAGIGGGKGGDGGLITVNAGTVKSTGGAYGAGIGGGQNGAGGKVTVNGGTLTVYGGLSGAGIGSGEDFGSTQQAPYLSTTVTINGRTVTTTGGSNGAGIGGGSSTNGGRVTITGGSVFANGFFGAGIGGGSGESGGEVSIIGGIVEVRAKGNNVKYGSGIGAGYSSNDQGSLELSEDAIVKASSKSGNNDDLKDLPLIDRASYLNDHSYRYVRIEMKNQRLKTGLKYRQTAQHEDKYYVRSVFVRPKSEFKNADKVIFTIHYKDETCTCESQYYYTSMISNGISYIPDSADSCLLVVTVSSSRNICDEATCDYELV